MLRFITATALVGAIVSTPTFAQTQNFDVLIPTGSNDGAFALVDKNKDGVYSAAGECWDYIKAQVNTSPRNYVLLGGKIFFTDTGLDQVVWVQDANGDGLIDDATERHVFYDVITGVGGCTPGFITEGASGWLWWVNDGCTGEGIYKSKDLNNDGDAEDTGETIPVLTETMTKVVIANTPITTGAGSGPLLSTTEIDSILYDKNHGTYGRYLVEDEWSDQTLAFEDKNNDGDFADAGECYLFCALYDGARTTRIDADVNPDVKTGKLPVSNEIRNHAVSYLTTPPTYYLMSGDTTPLNTDAAIIFRGQDGNNDGDINDAGEVTIFWDGSTTSTGAGKGYNFTLGMTIDLAGRLFVSAEWDATPDSERLIMLQDTNNDNDANDIGETTVLWNLGTDRTHYTPSIFPPGTLKTIAKANLAEIAYYGAATCRSSLSATSIHNIQFGRSTTTSGSAQSKAPVIGNSKWLLRTWGAAATANGAYAIGLVKVAAGIPLDIGKTCSVYHDFLLIVLNFTTAGTGDHDQIVPIPNDPTLIGLTTFWSSVVVDANAPAGLGITLSDAFEMKIGDYSYTK